MSKYTQGWVQLPRDNKFNRKIRVGDTVELTNHRMGASPESRAGSKHFVADVVWYDGHEILVLDNGDRHPPSWAKKI